jgi:hypothetical protein
MRRLSVWAAALVLLSGWGCKRKPEQTVMVDDESRPALSVLNVGHPRADTQLLSGFYGIEENSWRWTKGKFAVALVPPPEAVHGVRLELHFALPESLMSRRKAVTISAAVAGTPLAPETYTKTGDYTYTRDVPPEALAQPPVKVTFAIDNPLKPGEVEPRELGLVVTSIGFAGK